MGFPSGGGEAGGDGEVLGGAEWPDAGVGWQLADGPFARRVAGIPQPCGEGFLGGDAAHGGGEWGGPGEAAVECGGEEVLGVAGAIVDPGGPAGWLVLGVDGLELQTKAHGAECCTVG